jgi:hypothetical protein
MDFESRDFPRESDASMLNFGTSSWCCEARRSFKGHGEFTVNGLISTTGSVPAGWGVGGAGGRA